MSTSTLADFSIHDFLQQEASKDLLRFSTAGSVDDGKSTLIGRLLYDTQSVYEDQVRSIEGKGTTAPGQIDFALLTDGLRAEREQGITIDVAYRYFSTARRKFIIADTPGHEQYTRNMATGASTADATVVLIDATKGVLVQSRRHAYIASLLRVQHVLVTVNKMDLVGYDQSVFDAIVKDFREVLNQIAADTGTFVDAQFVPVSALAGDNIVRRSSAMPWYEGPSLLELLESLPASRSLENGTFRMPVQRVIRPDHTFRGFAGQITSGTVRTGDSIVALPSGKNAKVERIVTWDGDLSEANAPLSVTLVLDRELDISRGDLIAAETDQPKIATRVEASLVWMDQRPLDTTRRYRLKHTSHTVPAYISEIKHRVRVESLAHEPTNTLEMNSIGVVTVRLLRPIGVVRYADDRNVGSFILIDQATNATVAAGMISSVADTRDETEQDPWGAVTVGEREARWGHRGGVLRLSGSPNLIDAVERSLFSIGAAIARIDARDRAFLEYPDTLPLLCAAQTNSGLLTLLAEADESNELVAKSENEEITVDGVDFMSAVSRVHQLLHRVGILISTEKANL
ncbi:MAG: sulfate adenylyltransferase subunit CysN [Terracidiphilus sp.]|nr:sulfate adenylyltransferase subunit CysN [Terracidiphilus sp.]